MTIRDVSVDNVYDSSHGCVRTCVRRYVMSVTIERVSYTTGEVARLSGATYRQLDYWARTGWLEPSIRRADGSGSVRLYSEDDVTIARLIITISRLRENSEVLTRIATALHDGERVFAVNSGGDLVDPTSEPVVLLINLDLLDERDV